MRTTIRYSKAESIRFPAGTIDIPEHLSIAFSWVDLTIGRETEDERIVIIDVGRDMQATVWAESPVRLLGLFGPWRDKNDWKLASSIIGEEIWNRALQLIGGSNHELTFETNDQNLLVLMPTWSELLQNHRKTPVLPLPEPKGERDRAMEIFTSDPDFIQQGVSVAREIFGEHWDEPDK